VDYAEIMDAETFQPGTHIRRACYAALAVFFGSTRLIDNLFIEPAVGGDGNFCASL
jgi:pantoate--beta-alanine ligase